MICDLLIQEPKYLNFKGFKEGTQGLERNKIVARGTKEGCYFINPNLFGLLECDETFELDEDKNINAVL
ncbi:hypothetical protein [Bartonella tribocorum]|uniref:hypothetical protein n=1 Tax=Bartonella tribocorum TaxID=85701 RepID=UPI001FDAB7C3|nr:hypothetical protein [Bartonella tribocorum]